MYLFLLIYLFLIYDTSMEYNERSIIGHLSYKRATSEQYKFPLGMFYFIQQAGDCKDASCHFELRKACES